MNLPPSPPLPPLDAADGVSAEQRALMGVAADAFDALPAALRADLLVRLAARLHAADPAQFRAALNDILAAEACGRDEWVFSVGRPAPASGNGSGAAPWEDVWAAIQEERGGAG